MMNNFYRDREVLITGGAGFIGSNLAQKLVEMGAQVTIVDSLIPDYGGNLFNIESIRKMIQLNISDVRDPHAMEYLIKDKEYLFNLAGQMSHIDSMNDPFTDLEINVRSQLSILESCRKHNLDIKIVLASTRQIYGKTQYLPVNEGHPLCPTDVNGINKLAGEWYHILYNNVYGIRSCSIRLTNTYGPHQLIKHNRQGFIGWFIRQVVEGNEIQIYGDGKQMRDFNYVDDVVDAMLMVGASGRAWGEIYNLGSNEAINLKDLVETMISISDSGSYRLVPFPEEKKKIDIGSYYGDFSKIASEIGWQPQTCLRLGLEKTIEFYKNHLPKYL
jgi:nucleoside-diphosphate-sugar epimerase